MEEYLFTFRSITTAQRGKLTLERNQITSRLSRTPRVLASAGCGYCLRIRPADAGAAAKLLREAGIQVQKYYRHGPDGAVEEEMP